MHRPWICLNSSLPMSRILSSMSRRQVLSSIFSIPTSFSSATTSARLTPAAFECAPSARSHTAFWTEQIPYDLFEFFGRAC
ncbi:hypothetical protein B0H19DRAFT_1370267 [Mycena capillaripes]|nr:hypothetical protein B0H19DRAFT_1370267 [Mycena capillaripes]